MRASSVMGALRIRLHRRSAWVTAAAYGGLFLLASYYWNGWRPMPIGDVVYPFLLSFGYAFLAGFGWEWSGDDRVGPGFLRGLSQSILWSLLLLGVEITFYLAMPHGHGRSTRSLLAWTAILHWPLMVMVGLFSTQSEASEVTRREALAQAREAQWSLLRSQMSPHFLFNAISAFVELGRRDWPATEQGLLGLAEVYRQLLDLSEVMETTLGSEQKLVHRYLGVETLRLGPRLKVTWDWDATLDGETVPPLVLLPLVENALKHGLGLKEEGGELRIVLKRAGSCCVLEVANTGAWGGSPRTSNGVGLRNLRARLRLAYGDGGTLTLERRDAWTRATLALPLASTKPFQF